MNRRIIRENIMQLVYQMDVSDNFDYEKHSCVEEILRTALAEMIYINTIPANVSINEAVELGKTYGDDRSYAFINSVLGKINRQLHEQRQI